MAAGASPSRSRKYCSMARRTLREISSLFCMMLLLSWWLCQRVGFGAAAAVCYILQPVRMPGQAVKIMRYRLLLLGGGFQLVHRLAEFVTAAQPLGVPGNMLARDTAAAVLPVKIVH